MINLRHRYFKIILICAFVLLASYIYIDMALLDFGILNSSTRLSAGGTVFLHKPIDYEELSDRLCFVTNYGYGHCSVDKDIFNSADIAFCYEDRYGVKILLQFDLNSKEIDWDLERRHAKVTPEIWSQWDKRLEELKILLKSQLRDEKNET